MKVTIVVGGRWHAFDLAAQLHKKGVLHRLVTNYPAFVARRWGIPEERIVGLPVTYAGARLASAVSAGLGRRMQYLLHRSFARAAAKHVRGSDIVHCWSSFAEPTIDWARNAGIPCFLERGSSHISMQSALLREEFAMHGMHWDGTHPSIEQMELREYAACDAISVPSIFVERSFLDHRVPAGKIFRNPLGVDLARFRPPERAPPSPRMDNFEPIYAGSLSLRKGTPYLLDAFAKAKGPGWRLTLVGGQLPEVRRWVNPAPAGVRLLGHRPQSELAQLYGRAHCFVMPSIEEGMAMVQMQALACGLPLICTTNTGGEDLLRMEGDLGEVRPHGVTEFPAGYLVPIRKPESIAWCLRQLAGESGLWNSKRASALRLAGSRLDWSRYTERALEQYDRMARSKIEATLG